MSESSESPRQRSQPQTRGPWLWPLALAGVGIVLLLDNFLLLGDFNVTALLPLLLVVAGAQILLRGDILPSAESRTFGITRGSVESATLEVNSGEIDVEIGALQREGRLIAGQYAPQSRPQLLVDGTHTTLRMMRSQTPWLFWGDWQLGLAQDLPWGIFISTHLGQANLDFSRLIIQEAAIATGLGDVRLICPREALSVLYVRSAVGNLHIISPERYRVRITVRGGRLFGVHADSQRYLAVEPNVFVTHDALQQTEDGFTLLSDEEYPLVDIEISGTFGDAYLS